MNTESTDEQIREIANSAIARTSVNGCSDTGSRHNGFALSRKKISINDFHALMPMHQYIFEPTRELWPAASINSRFPPVTNPEGDDPINAARWLDINRPVEQMTWAPGLDMLIKDRVMAQSGWLDYAGVTVFNLYRPPETKPGDPRQAGKWIDHIAMVYPNDVEHIIKWLAHRVQYPGVKLNHALFLGGGQGIGKDTLLEPVKYAIGTWNFEEIAPTQITGRFNGYVKSVILRISEARDLGDVDRYAFYERSKTLIASPPDVLRIDEKHLREYSAPNVCGVVITSNHKHSGIYLPADDRRHYVAWSEASRNDFIDDYWTDLWDWYASGGLQHAASYLSELDLSGFDCKAPPLKTEAFWQIVNSNNAPEDAELADVLDSLGKPDAVTLEMIRDRAILNELHDLADFLTDKKVRRQIPHRMEDVGYEVVRNAHATDGLFKVKGRRRAIYAKREFSPSERYIAARKLN